MQFWIGVENFAKIESAKICVDNYTVLVGENNSGKTFLMQLVQGVGKKIVNFVDESVLQGSSYCYRTGKFIFTSIKNRLDVIIS